jgi:hypothetical protein
MPKTNIVWKQKFALKLGGAPRLELYSEKAAWKNVSIRVDNKKIGNVDNLLRLKKGFDFHLEDGSVLRFESGHQGNGFRLEIARYKYPRILINGNPIPGSDALKKLVRAYVAIFAIAAFYTFFLVLSLPRYIILLFTLSDPSLSSNYGIYEALRILTPQLLILIVWISVNIFLGFLVKDKSKPALIFAIILNGINLLILGFVTVIDLSSSSLVIGLLLLCFHAICWIRICEGLAAIKELTIK